MRRMFLAVAASAIALAGFTGAAPAPESTGDASAKPQRFYKSRISKWAAKDDSVINAKLETAWSIR